jgi:hypothetical protein
MKYIPFPFCKGKYPLHFENLRSYDYFDMNSKEYINDHFLKNITHQLNITYNRVHNVLSIDGGYELEEYYVETCLYYLIKRFVND